MTPNQTTVPYAPLEAKECVGYVSRHVIQLFRERGWKRDTESEKRKREIVKLPRNERPEAKGQRMRA